MLAAQSADGLRRVTRVRAILRAAKFSPGEKILLLALNAWPLVHVAAGVALALAMPWSLGWRAPAVLGWLLLLPPVLSRLVAGSGLPSGEVTVPSRAFFRWWTTWQLQMLFNRLPWIDETLRLVPGLYSLWLRLWGARIGRLTLWSPGVRVFDRPLLRVGDDVVFGIDVRLAGHFGGVDPDGRACFTLGPITVGDRTTIGGGAFLGPGVVVEADQATEALFLGAPFTRWRAGERISGRAGTPPFSPP